MRIILLIVFYIATCVARIAVDGDNAKIMPGRSMRYSLKSGTARSGISEMPIDDGIIRMMNKHNGQSSLGNRINGFSQRRNNLKRVKRSLRKRKKCAKKNSDCRIARRRNNYVDDDIDEQNTPSNVVRFPIWQIPESTVPANNLDSTMIMRTETSNRSLLAFERPQLKNLDYDRSVNETIFPIAKRHPHSPKLLDTSVKDLMLSKIANPKSEIIDVQSPTFERLNNKMQPAYRPGILTGVDSNYPQGFQQQYERNVHQKVSSNNNVKEELFNNPPVGSNERFLLVPVSNNLYVLKDIRESPQTGVDRIIVPKKYEPLERDKDNATSAILSFKAHMHHDVKDVGRAYLQRGNFHRLSDHNANYLYSTLDPRVSEETASSTENPTSYPNFLYPGIAFQTRSTLIATSEISDEQMVSPVPDYASISFTDINLRGGINSYDSSAFLSSSSSTDTPNYDILSKENANDRDQSSILSATKLDEINLPQDSGNSFGYSELTTTSFRDIFDHNIYKPVTFEMYLTNDKEVFDVSQNLGDESKFSTGRNEDESVVDFIDNISQYKAAFDAPANEDNTFFPNITYTFVNNAEDGLNSEDIDKDIGQEYGITIAGEYSNKKTTYSNDFDYNNRSTDEALLSNNATNMDLFLNEEDYVTVATLFPNTDEWPLKKAQSNVENSHVLLMAIKPLSSELQKLLSAVKLVNQSLSDVQNRLCDKKNIIRTERESKDGKATNIVKLTNKDRYDSDFFTESFSSQSLNKRRFKTKDESVAERDVKIGRETNDLFLNKLTTPFHKRESSISNSEVQSGRRNFHKKGKLNEREFSKSGDVGRRRLSRSRFNRNLKSLTKSYEMRVTPIRQFIEAGLKRMKRTTTPITRSRFIKSDISGENNFAGGRAQNYQGNNQSRSIMSPNNTPSTFLNIFTKDNSVHLSSDEQDLQRDLKRAMSGEISDSDKEKKFLPIDRQFYKEATAYLDIIKLLSKTEKPHMTDVWTTQSLTESLPPLIFTTTGFSVSALTFLPYFTEESTITTLSTIAEKKEAPVTDFTYKDYENMTSETSEIISLTQSPVTLSAFTITMPTTSSLFYTTEITILPIDEAAILTTEIVTEKIIISVAITTEVTETPIPIIPTVKNFTTESTMLLTPILEGMTDITLKIKIPAATETSIEEILIKTETMTTEEETVEGTSTTLTTELERMETFLSTSTEVPITTLIPEDESPVTQIEKTITAEETATEIPTTIETATPTKVAITTTETEISTSMETAITEILTINKTLTTALQTSIETSTVSEILTISTTLTTIKASTITETLTPTEILTITLKTPIVKGTTSVKTLTPTETSIETSTTTEISTSIETIITGILINKTLTVAETSTFIETSTVSEIPTISTILTTEATTITKTLTPTEILTTTLKIPITEGTTSAKTLIPTETLTPKPIIETLTKTITEISATTETLTTIKSTTITEILIINKTLTTTETSSEISTASEISTTSAIKITTEATTVTETPTKILTTLKTPITKETTSAKTLTPTETTLTLTETKTTTEMSTINKTLTTETPTFIETSTASEIPTSTILTTTETTIITETPTKILTTLKTPITKETTSAKILTPTEIKTTTEISTSIKTTTTIEILTINKTLKTTETPTSIKTSTASEIPMTSTISTTTITITPTKILTTLKIPITKGTTSAKTLTPTETLTSIETKTTTEISTSVEITATTEILTTTETLTTTGTSVFIEASTTSEIPTTTEITAITETSTLTEILATTEIPTIKKTMSTKATTPTIMKTSSTTETPTTKSLETTEIPVISTTYITTKFFTSESTMSTAMTSPKEFFPTSILTTFTTIFTETTESISSTPVTTTFVPTTISTLKLTTTTPLQTLITNTTLSETPSTISSTVFTTERSVITSLKTAVPTTSLKVARPLLITSTMLSETPSTTFLIEETTASSILTTSSLETVQTTAVLPIFTTVSTVETPRTTSSVAIYTTVNATVSSTAASTITSGKVQFESTTSPVIHFTVTTPSITKTPITPVIGTGTTAYETTSTLATSFFLTETIEVSTTSPREETEEYKEYYESTKEEIATVTSEKLTTEEYTTWVTEEVTIIRETTPTTYLFTTLSFIETTTEAITLPTTEETEVEITVTPVTAIEGISTLSEVTLISTETSTMSVETSSLIPTIAATTASLLEETTTEISETSWITTTLLPTTERPEYVTILEAAVTVTLVPFSESILSILITSEIPPTTPEVISVLPKTVSEEFTMSTTESPLITYATKSSTALFAETTTYPVVSILTTTEEAETEYYIAKEPFYEEEFYEEYEEHDTEIPTGKWYYYDEYGTTTKKWTTATVKYTKLFKEKASPPFLATTSPEIEISEFTRYSTPSEIIPTSTNVTSTAATSETSYTKEEVTSTSETSTLTIIENVTTVEAKTEVTTSVSEKTESITFGSTEEYTLPPTTIFRIPTEPLEHLTIPPKYTDLERFTHIWRTVTSRKFITKPKKIPEIVLEKTTVSERVSKETEVAEKLTSFFVSSALTTLSEKEAFKVHTTTMSTASSETESTVETGYEITTLAMTEEEIVPRVTPFITSEAEIEVTTTSETIEREKQKEQLLRQLDVLKQRQREMTEREERLKEKEKQWYIEKEKRRKMMQREKEMSTTEVEGLETFITTSSLAELTTVSTETTPFSTTEEITSVTYTTEKTEKATTEGSTSTMYTTKETEETVILHTIELTSIKTPTFYTIKEIYTVSYVSETTPSSITEEITSVAYTTEEATTGSTSTTYATEETEETVIPYVTEKSTSTYLTEEIEEVQITDYVTLMPYVTASIMDLYNVGLASTETVTPYTVEEAYTTSYVTLYSETFASSTITSPIITATDKFVTLPIATFSERFEETSIASVTTPTWYTTEETYTVTYTDIYSKFLFTSPTLEFISTTTSSTLAVITPTEVKYDEEIEKLREKLRRKERELEEREKILLEREKRLERDIMEFEKYMAEFEKKETSVFSSEKSTVLTSLSTPVPPTERTTIKAQLTTQIKRVTEKRENKTTTKMVTSRQTEMGEKKRTKHVPEEEIATKRICLNVLENTTIPLDKRRRGIATKKICLSYFPEEKKSVGRLNRRLLALQSARKNRRSRSNVPLEYRCRRRVEETTRKIDNLQLLHHEWLSNETTKPLRYFKGFTRIYEKMRKFPKKVATVIDMRGNVTSDFQNRTSLYGRRVLDYYEDVFQPTAASMLNGEEHRKRDIFFRYDLTSARKNNFFIGDKTNVRKRDVSSTENNARFWSKKSTVNTSNQRVTTATIEKDEFYTVNVLHLSYNEDKQTHEVISAKPDEDELRVILSETNGDNYVAEFGENRKVTTPYYEIEEEDNLKEDDKLTDETEQKPEEDEDYIEDMIDNYMNYEEHETSTLTHDRKFLDDEGKDKKMTVNERELLAQTWPTEKSTTYHLGGTKFWELEFVTEPSVSRTTIDKGKTIDVSITRTTCLDVVLKNERNSEIKSNISYHKRDIYSNRRRRRKDVSVEKRNASLRNVTRKNALRYKLKTQRSRMIAKKLKRDSPKLHDLSYSKRGFEEGMRATHFRRTSNEDSITARSRKLCGVNASKLKRQIANHEDKRKKKQPTKSRTLQNINLRSLHNTDNCVVNKKNKNKHHKTTTTTANPQVKKPDVKKKDEKIVHLNKNKSTLHEKKVHNCLNCICDITNIVNNIKSLLDRVNFPLDEIKALNCSEYKEIQDKIVMSMDSDVEEAREFPQPHYNIESLKGQKYIKLEELEDNFKSDSELDSDHDVVSLPGLNLNLPCNQDGDGITWLSSVSRPSYTWKRTDGIALFGFVAENGDLELRNVNAKDTGNYTCVMTYMNPDNEEPVETAYEVHLQVVTLPRYVMHGESRYHVRSCDERDLDVLVTYLPLKLNSVICEADVCNAYVLTSSCSRSQITVNVLLVPSHIVKLMTIDPKHCNVFCLKAIQDKLSLVLSKNLQIFLGKTIIFRLPHYEQRLVPIVERSSFTRQKRGKTDANGFAERSSNVGLFSSCPAGYGLRDTRCVPCNMGTYSEDGISHCKKCPPGTYQPNHGARVCRTCTNPMTKGCYNMLWNSFSAIMVTLASIGAMLSICFLLLWIICCAKKKFCVKRIAGIAANEDVFKLEKRVEEQSLIKDASENEDQQWDNEYRVKKKKGKFYVNKKRRKQNERRKYDKTHEDEWGSHRIKNAPIICPDSYQSHEDYNNYYPKQSYRKGPRLPECDFDT